MTWHSFYKKKQNCRVKYLYPYFSKKSYK